MKLFGNKALTLFAVVALAATATPALATSNSDYGETRINQLPQQGKSAHALWVGSWWAYKRDGIAYRHKTSGNDFAECQGVSRTASPQALVDADQAFCLSAAEKIDFLKGRLGDIEWEKLDQYQEITQDQISPLSTSIRTLVRRLNKWIGENPGDNWRETDDGREYLEKKAEIDTAREALPEVDVDTATEFERIEHGNGVAGVEGWWGHCNAWAAASMMEVEPKARGTVTYEGRSVDVTPGEAKALYTEAWMEHHSSFKGSRSDDPENSIDSLSYADVTPAAMHIFFASQLGQQGKSFVIDRYTGSEVWNQSVRSYKFEIEPLYQEDQAESVELSQTDYDRQGNASKRALGAQDVYPVHVTAHLHWMTDGLPHEVQTVDNITADSYPENHTELRALWGDQVEMRELTYTLYLDKPLSDAAAKIVGDGKWDETLHGDNHAWPDFMWQPLAQTPTRRNYENPHIDYENLVVGHIIPATAAVATGGGTGTGGDEEGSGTFDSSDTPIDIPDNDRNGISSTLSVERAGRITALSVTVDVTHTWRGDLRVVLEKDGQKITLHDRSGGGSDDLKKTFDVPQLNGQELSGEFALHVFDTARRDVGKLNSWRVDAQWGGGDPTPDVGGAAHELTSADTPRDIPDNDAGGIKSTIQVNESGTVGTLSVTVNITHTYRGDLRVILQKGSQEHVLHNNEGRSEDNLNETYELPALAGEALSGAWVLKVSDHARIDVGTLDGWKLNVSTR